MQRTQAGGAGAIAILLAGLADLPPADALVAGAIVAVGSATEGIAPLLEAIAEFVLGVEIPIAVTELPQHVVDLAAANGLLDPLAVVVITASIVWISGEIVMNRVSSS